MRNEPEEDLVIVHIVCETHKTKAMCLLVDSFNLEHSVVESEEPDEPDELGMSTISVLIDRSKMAQLAGEVSKLNREVQTRGN